MSKIDNFPGDYICAFEFQILRVVEMAVVGRMKRVVGFAENPVCICHDCVFCEKQGDEVKTVSTGFAGGALDLRHNVADVIAQKISLFCKIISWSHLYTSFCNGICFGLSLIYYDFWASKK